MKAFADLAAAYRQLGPLRFTLIAGGTIALILTFTLAFVILSDRIGWPENYGFTCRRKCVLDHMWHSPKLLAGGARDELLLFFVIWSIPLAGAVFIVPSVLMRLIKRRRDRIRPMDRSGS
jgi:hypothetical protein